MKSASGPFVDQTYERPDRVLVRVGNKGIMLDPLEVIVIAIWQHEVRFLLSTGQSITVLQLNRAATDADVDELVRSMNERLAKAHTQAAYAVEDPPEVEDVQLPLAPDEVDE